MRPIWIYSETFDEWIFERRMPGRVIVYHRRSKYEWSRLDVQTFASYLNSRIWK